MLFIYNNNDFPVYKIQILCMKIINMETPRKEQGPVVQSIVSLTSSLRVMSLTILADSVYNILIFFAEKM